MKLISKIETMFARVHATVRRWLRKITEMFRCALKQIAQILSRAGAEIVVHKESLGYYVVLTLVLIALSAVANDYRSKKMTQSFIEALPTQEPGVSVQSKPDQTLPPEEEIAEYIWPVRGTIIGHFSDDELKWSTTLQLWQTHPAVDIAAAVGETVQAAADGTVVEAYSDALYGNVIVVDHGDGSILRYSSLNTLKLVSVGQKVDQGDIISAVGTCDAEADLGAHVHLEYFVNQSAMDFELLFKEAESDSLQN